MVLTRGPPEWSPDSAEPAPKCYHNSCKTNHCFLSAKKKMKGSGGGTKLNVDRLKERNILLIISGILSLPNREFESRIKKNEFHCPEAAF
jgi:hypothetical protein